MAAFATNSPPQRRPFWHFPSLQPPWWGLSRSLCKSVSSYRYLSIFRLASSSHISWFSTRAQPVWQQPSPQERYSSRTKRQRRHPSGIFVLSAALGTAFWRLLYPSPPPQQTFGDLCPRTRSDGNLLAAYASFGPGSTNPFGVFHPCNCLAAALWQLSSSHPLLQTAVCTSDRGSRTQKEAAWGRRRPLGGGTCAWGALC